MNPYKQPGELDWPVSPATIKSAEFLDVDTGQTVRRISNPTIVTGDFETYIRGTTDDGSVIEVSPHEVVGPVEGP